MKLRLYQALGALSETLAAAAAAKAALSAAAKDVEWAHEDEALGVDVGAERAAMNRVLGAYAAALEAAEEDPAAHTWIDAEGRFRAHMRVERRFVGRLDSKVLAHLARAYRDLAADARDVPDDEDSPLARAYRDLAADKEPS